MKRPTANQSRTSCPDCLDGLTRRDFVRAVGGAAIAAGALPLLGARPAWAAPSASSPAETVVSEFYKTLSDKQRKAICLAFDDERRFTINANWHVTEPTIGDSFFSVEQRGLIDQILRHVTSEDGYDLLQRQMVEDYGGVESYSVALFGEPGTGQFQWMMTGRHLTIRADGDSAKNVAFGGPMIYGHGAEDPAENVFHFQTKKANEVFEALDPKQREQALVAKAPKENQVNLQGDRARFKGIAVGDLSSDQKGLFEEVVGVLLAPYRKEDVDEALQYLKDGGGFDKLHLAFYKEGDLQDDQIWDIWRVEGPTFVWHFRGAPHVHTYVNIGKKA